MKVSELAKRVGIAPSAIRFYESRGILPSPRRGDSGYRDYAEEDLCRVRVLVSLRSLGLDLLEAGSMADQCSTGHCDEMAENLLPQIVARRAEVASARAELDHLDTELATLESLLRNGDLELGLNGEGNACHGDQACCN